MNRNGNEYKKTKMTQILKSAVIKKKGVKTIKTTTFCFPALYR